MTAQERKLKTIQLSPVIAQGDLETKMRHAKEFLEKGCRVKIEMRLKGRQNMHTDLALQKMDVVMAALQSSKLIVEKKPTLDGKIIIAQVIEKQKL